MKSLTRLTLAAGVVFVAMAGQAIAAGDPAAGEKVFNKCKACHQVGETAKNAVAPELNGINGRKAASVEGYTYSDALKASGITWDEANFKEFVKNPKAKVAGTKMVFPGLPKEQEQEDVWAYLGQFGADGKKK
jgi:cytochrome c